MGFRMFLEDWNNVIRYSWKARWLPEGEEERMTPKFLFWRSLVNGGEIGTLRKK